MPPEPSPTPRSSLTEARYSLKDLLREVDYERQHSVLGLELVDQSEIGLIFKARSQRKAKKKATSAPFK